MSEIVGFIGFMAAMGAGLWVLSLVAAYYAYFVVKGVCPSLRQAARVSIGLDAEGGRNA